MQTVVGAVIVADGRVLAARRSERAGSAGFWEFPGGKVEPGEDPRAALVREINEELSTAIVVGDEIGDVPWVISETLELRLFLASLAGGDPQPGEDHDELRWLALDALDSVAWLPSDRLALEVVRSKLRS
ncbi:MAG TPA: (deoxy)nucleoside triphosphate pyrophosphohydrolase [Mycobacteriales bacterium]|nr:(deoxy)nucleoside triphosphate pyrophosphohydrolase [Mycobacteriales bacterium]